MTPEELDRRYRLEPDETAQAREAVEDRAADHAPADLRSRQGAASPPFTADGASNQRPPSRGSAAISPADSECASSSHHACQCSGERLREALAVAGDLREMAEAPALPGRHPNAMELAWLADRLDGGRS